MGARVAVAGASGYAGGELLRLLAGHPALEIGALGAGSNAGAPVTAVHPNLITLADRTFGPTTPDAFAGSDLVFMALPHDEAAKLAQRLPEETKIIDLGAGFRLADPVKWAQFYGGDHPGTWAYGLAALPRAPGPASGPPSRPRAGWPRPAVTPPPRLWPWPRCWPTAWPTPRTS